MRQATTSRSDKAKLREKQILDAAKHCFSRVGFHSTSMAQIAAQAQMSVGQIYRHFRSKESLIEGIVEEDVARQLSAMVGVTGKKAIEGLTMTAHKKDLANVRSGTMHLALMLEIVAEAARNPRVRDIVLSTQRRGHAALKKRIEADQPGAWPARDLDACLRVVSALQAGVLIQIMIDPRAPATAMLNCAQAVTKRLLMRETNRDGRRKG